MKYAGGEEQIREQILQRIAQAAYQDTPEWRFDREDPDVGTALACVYADLMTKTMSRFEQVLYKHRVEFFNSLDAEVLPPVPASGYAVFEMVNDSVEGTEVPSGMKVYADAEDGDITFCTVDDVYATSAEIQVIYQVWNRQDSIRRLYAKGQEKKELHFFDAVGENLQEHVLYLGCDEVLHIGHEAYVYLHLYRRGDIPVPREVLQYLAQEQYALFSYAAQEDYVPLHPRVVRDGLLEFHIEESSAAFAQREVEEKTAFWLRCQIRQLLPFRDFFFDRIRVSAKSNHLLPDIIYGNGLACDPHEYVPFGERFGIYHEAYFACTEALSKRGSTITFSFNMDFVRVPLMDEGEGPSIPWEWIMKRSDFEVDADFDLTIQEVLWEYFNGNGWSRIFPDSRYVDIFSTERGLKDQYRTMTFTCPKDIQPLLVDSCESYYIRARVIKIQNLYKNKGYYVTPVLSDTTFTYDYGTYTLPPMWVYTKNNLEKQMYQGGNFSEEQADFRPFHAMELHEDAIYVGLQAPISQGPVKMLFTMLEDMVNSHMHLRWEYYSRRGFRELNLVDETRGFSRTGLVTLMGEPDFAKTSLFGQTLYWLRIVDEGSREMGMNTSYPCVEDIHINAVKITNVDYEETQYFVTERYEEKRQITLLHPHVIGVELWVDELSQMSENQLKQLSNEYEIELVRSPEGILRNAWVKWKEVSDFFDATSTSRCFCIDKNAGVITFGDGRHGRIVLPERKENIRISYRCGGGLRTNLPAGAINRMGYTLGFIRGVTNPYKLLGGCDQETVEEAITRNAQLMKNHHRAVTAEDFEQLARCAARSIQRVRCFTGRDATGAYCPGAMTMVVLQQESSTGRYAFHDLKEKIRGYLQDKVDGRINLAERLYIIEPEFVELHVRLEVVAQDFRVVFQMKKEMETRLQRFLDPLTGHFDGHGWKIGTLPTVVQLQNLLRDVRGMKYIRNIYLSAFVTGNGGRTEVDLKKTAEHPFVVPVSGTHNIVVKVD